MVSRRSCWRPVFIAAAVAIFIGVLGGTLTDTGAWYQNLQKPSWQPPDWLFGPAWTLIFALCALAAVMYWRQNTRREARQWLLAAYALNAFLNTFWSLLFFRLQRPDWALMEVPFLWLSILLLIFLLKGGERRAPWVLVPYVLWVSFAAVLNWKIVQLNAPFG